MHELLMKVARLCLKSYFLAKVFVLRSKANELVPTPLLYNLRVCIHIFALVGGACRRRVSHYKSEYLCIHEYLYNKILVS